MNARTAACKTGRATTRIRSWISGSTNSLTIAIMRAVTTDTDFRMATSSPLAYMVQRPPSRPSTTAPPSCTGPRPASRIHPQPSPTPSCTPVTQRRGRRPWICECAIIARPDSSSACARSSSTPRDSKGRGRRRRRRPSATESCPSVGGA